MIDKDPLTVDVPREFHRRMAATIDAVQTGMWEAGVHDLLGHATDYAFGQQRGVQTLVLKSKHRSAYVRLRPGARPWRRGSSPRSAFHARRTGGNGEPVAGLSVATLLTRVAIKRE